MSGRTLRIIISAGLTALALVVVGLLASFILADAKTSLGLILFVIGALPLVIFSPGLLGGGKSGAIHTPKVIYRLVDTLAPGKKASSPGAESRTEFDASLSWVLAGLMVWAVSYFV